MEAKEEVVVEPEDKNKMVKDPVCGMVKKISEMKDKSVYQGETYYFCCEDDKKMFEANPDHWLKKGKQGGV